MEPVAQRPAGGLGEHRPRRRGGTTRRSGSPLAGCRPHEAAIANGWDPADGSPWVGPDGVTYASKDDFYVAQLVDRAKAAARADNEASQGVAHRDNCLCNKAARAVPPRMLEERDVESASRIGIFGLLDMLDRNLEVPMVRTRRERWNAAGEHIGPDLKIRVCDALLFDRVLDRVLVVIERAAERQR